MSSQSRQPSQTPSLGGAGFGPASSSSGALPPSGVAPRAVAGASDKMFPFLTNTYVRAARAAYNMCVKLVRNLSAPWMILVTAMSYWHRFFFFSIANGGVPRDAAVPPPQGEAAEGDGVARSANCGDTGSRQQQQPQRKPLAGDFNPHITFDAYHPVLVAITSVFIAFKAECVHRTLEQIIRCAFDIPSNNPAAAPHYQTRRQQILRLELMMLHTLKFELFQELPWTRAQALISGEQQIEQQQQQQQFASVVGANSTNSGNLRRLFERLLGYVVQLPYQTKMLGVAIAECTVWFAADALDCLTPHLAAQLTSVNGAVFSAFAAHLVEFIAYFDAGKFNDVPKIQAQVVALRARLRETAAGGTGTRRNSSSAAMPGSSVGVLSTTTPGTLSASAHLSTSYGGGGGVTNSSSMSALAAVNAAAATVPNNGTTNNISPPPLLGTPRSATSAVQRIRGRDGDDTSAPPPPPPHPAALATFPAVPPQ